MNQNADNRQSILKQRGGIWSVIGVLLVAGIVATFVIQTLPKPKPPAPFEADTPRHLIVISIDTLRADHIGAYGHKAAKTPILDNLAAEGVMFERHYTCYPLTLPSHLTQLTGVSTLGHRVRDNLYHRLAPQIITLPEVLNKNGFTCGAFVSAYTMHGGSGIERGFAVYDDEGVNSTPPGRMTVPERKAEDTLARAAKWLEKVGTEKRLFCYIHLFDPHAPYDPPADLKAEFAGKPNGLYDAEIAYTDRELGKFFNKAKALGIFDNALVVVTADHGEGLGEHDELSHGYFCYDTTTHIPLILRGGKTIKAGGRPAAITRNYDLSPTLMELLGVEDGVFAAQFHGRSLRDVCENPAFDPGLNAYIESHYGYINTGWAKIRGLRGKDALTLFSGELVERLEDPAQTNNVAAQRADAVAKDREEIARTLNSLRPPAGARVHKPGDPGLGTPYPGESFSEQSFEAENIADTRDNKAPSTQAKQLLRYQEAELAYDEERFEACAAMLRDLLKQAPDLVPARKLLAAVNQLRVQRETKTLDDDDAYRMTQEAFENLLAGAEQIERTGNREAAYRMRLNAALLACWLGKDQLFEKAYAPYRAVPTPELQWLLFIARYIDGEKKAEFIAEAETFLKSARLPENVRHDAQATLQLMREGKPLKLAPWEQ
ncbi:MAG: sulfatase [Planctomycetes bacterium]|nr:sulfatase [Planctomycetota bacterium]